MKTVVCFVSRPHGFSIVDALVNSPKYKILKIFTHSLNPKSQDPTRSQRTDFQKFVQICQKNCIPLEKIDEKNQSISDVPQCDFIVEVSWRYLIGEEITNKANIVAFGIHRGKLPEYAGAQPIKQALENNEKNIVLSAHYLDSEIDQGTVIDSISHPVNYINTHTLDENIRRLRDEITELFPKLMFNVFKFFNNSS
ncbi:Bifunctional polymyxin resistance protein ArnA [Marine Group I thaumarchaeote SCGC AAA799-P11]|uniref:Bifunctional polymyxin resistance protein ArnA n=1 Tax=Marine Group I thaumarchaeote SCGC AAA799-P11 TaxID=1502295 RepID=A0A087S2Z5_9ARCH|nr:Bifunctional polymyxin resistance protein ArnA [Marine Group I thaumarchaeote SCGC AAA799-P11]